MQVVNEFENTNTELSELKVTRDVSTFCVFVYVAMVTCAPTCL